MNEQARKIYRTPKGQAVFRKILHAQPFSPEDKETLAALEKADPSTIRQPASNLPQAVVVDTLPNGEPVPPGMIYDPPAPYIVDRKK